MMTKKTKVVNLTFYRSELIYDISNKAYVEGDVMTEENMHAKHQTIDITQDGNVDWVNRTLNLAFSECVEMMYPYTKIASEDPENYDDVQTAPETYKVTLVVPLTFSKTTGDLLSKLIHEYLVARVLSDWFSTTNPQVAARWLTRMEDLKESLRGKVAHIGCRVRLKLNPF